MSLLISFTLGGLSSQIGLLVSPIADAYALTQTAAAAQFSWLTGGILAGNVLAAPTFSFFNIRCVVACCYVVLVGCSVGLHTMPTFFLAEEKGFRLLGHPVDMEIFYLQNTLETSRAFIRKNRDQALRFMKGYIEGIAYFKKHKAESIGVLRKKLRIQSEQERDSRYLELSYNLLASKLYRDIPYPSIPAVQTVLGFIGAESPKQKALV